MENILDKLTNLSHIFQLVYGRNPSQDQINVLTHLNQAIPDNDSGSLFRAIINSFHHQQFNTPFTVRFSKQDVEYINVQNAQVAIDKMDTSVSMLIRRKEYEPHLLAFYSQRLKPGMVVIDIGANVGLYSMLAAKKVGKRGKVFSFDPNSENCRLILLGIHKNEFKNVSVFPFALGNRTGHVLFSTHIGSNGGLISDSYDSLLNPSCVIKPIVRLDDIVTEKVDLIKIDVEGAEGLVVEGAKGLIEKYRPIVTSEFSLEMLSRVSNISGKDYLQGFKDMNYSLFIIDKNTYCLDEILDIDKFIGNFGELSIEDLAFIPHPQ